jgi:nucleotide-binding universal stress UspA family protein
MERILVGIDATHPTFDALIRALCLGQRIGARVVVLAVFPEDGALGPESAGGAALMRSIETEIRSAKAQGTSAELFVASGRYDVEVIRAVREMKTTLLVAPAQTGERGQERETENLGRIVGAVDCRVELVSPKKTDQRTKDEA